MSDRKHCLSEFNMNSVKKTYTQQNIFVMFYIFCMHYTFTNISLKKFTCSRQFAFIIITITIIVVIIIVIIIIIIIIIISFMQGIYTYIPETNYVAREYSVATILLLLFMVLISLVPVLNLLYFYISTFRSMWAYYYYYYHHHHHYHHHHLLYAGYVYLYSWDKLCP